MDENLKTEVAVLAERVSAWMETTTEYRKTLCLKIDLLFKKVGELPCDKRGYIASQIRYLWGAITMVLILVVTAFFNHVFAK